MAAVTPVAAARGGQDDAGSRYVVPMKVHVIRTQTSWPVTGVWSALSVAVAVVCSFSFLQPAWFLRKDAHYASGALVLQFGLFSFCLLDPRHTPPLVCRTFQEDRQHSSSTLWPVVCVLCGSAALVLDICAILALVTLALPSHLWRKRVAYLTGHVQLGAVLTILLGVLLYPLGLGSDFVRHHCGDSAAPFWAASCELGWAFMLTLVTALIGLYCPVLARFTVSAALHPDALANLNYIAVSYIEESSENV